MIIFLRCRVQASAGATDFAAFNALVRSERLGQQQSTSQQQGASQQQQHRGVGVAPSRPPRQPVAVTTFDSLTSNRLPDDGADHAAQLEAVRLRGALRDACLCLAVCDVIDGCQRLLLTIAPRPSPSSRRLLQQTNTQIRSLYDFGASSRDGLGGGGSMSGWPSRAGSMAAPALADGAAAADAKAAPAQQRAFDLEGLAAAPWDWALKTRARITSSARLACLEDAAGAGLGPACRAASSGGAGGGSSSGGASASGASSASTAERLAAALLQWQHPALPLSADALAVMAAGASTREMLGARVRSWRDSLRGLWAAVRHGQCAAAYVVGATVSRSLQCLLFGAVPHMCCLDVAAVSTPSHPPCR